MADISKFSSAVTTVSVACERSRVGNSRRRNRSLPSAKRFAISASSPPAWTLANRERHCDALLGAAALGDIGRHYPDTDASYENLDSRVLLRDVTRQLHERAYRIGNVDVTVIAQRPRLADHIATMEQHLCADLGVEPGQVNIKATTTEKLGYLGREEGIAAHAVAIIQRPTSATPLAD